MTLHSKQTLRPHCWAGAVRQQTCACSRASWECARGMCCQAHFQPQHLHHQQLALDGVPGLETPPGNRTHVKDVQTFQSWHITRCGATELAPRQLRMGTALLQEQNLLPTRAYSLADISLNCKAPLCTDSPPALARSSCLLHTVGLHSCLPLAGHRLFLLHIHQSSSLFRGAPTEASVSALPDKTQSGTRPDLPSSGRLLWSPPPLTEPA